MCELSIKVPIRKKSGNLSYAPRILYILSQCIIQLFGTNIVCLFVVSPGHSWIFSVLCCSHLGWLDLCKVILLWFWILCGILSDRQRTIRGLLASSKPFPLGVLLVFYTSLESRLWVCNCLEQFLCFGPFGLV